MDILPSSLRIETNFPLDVDETIHRRNDRDIGIKDFMGFSIFYGKNAFSNETLIHDHKEKHENCIWLHAADAIGAHVVLCLRNKKEAESTALRQAALIALQYSKSSLKTVSYAPLKDVYKPDGSRPGVFRTWRTETLEV